MQSLSSSTRKMLGAAGVFMALGALPMAASAKLVCTTNSAGEQTSCTCTESSDPNCTAEWCDGAFSNGPKGPTCTFTTPRPKQTLNMGKFGLTSKPGSGNVPLVLPTQRPSPTTKN